MSSMNNKKMSTIHDTDNEPRKASSSIIWIASFVIGLVVLIATLGITIATLVKVMRIHDENQNSFISSTVASTTIPTSTTTNSPDNPSLSRSIRIENLIFHLEKLQSIATSSNGTRVVNSPGYNRTLDYIEEQLRAHTNYIVNKTFFNVRDFKIAGEPTLSSLINGQKTDYIYSNDLSKADFYHLEYSISINMSDFVQISVIPNGGCYDVDWQKASLPPQGRIALVKRGGSCYSSDKAIFAEKYNVLGLLLYNDGTSSDRLTPVETNLAQNSSLPALYLSYALGKKLAESALNSSTNTTVQLFINVEDRPPFPVGNICADTPTGNINETIVIGSHSDSVKYGPGINDNGSGTMANLAIAIALAELYRMPTYPKYRYRVRFCWWGAEEVDLLGSEHYVEQAKHSTVVGERLLDNLVNLNFDMLGSPNYFFGIYDGETLKNSTPTKAREGTKRITKVFTDWFDKQKLPWNYTEFAGGSDYAPFLAAGIVAGGLFSGADDIKTNEERDFYHQMLGPGMGGIAGITHDPCYHKACDSFQNINMFVYEKMVQSAAYVVEFLGRKEELHMWLYPNVLSDSFHS